MWAALIHPNLPSFLQFITLLVASFRILDCKLIWTGTVSLCMFRQHLAQWSPSPDRGSQRIANKNTQGHFIRKQGGLLKNTRVIYKHQSMKILPTIHIATVEQLIESSTRQNGVKRAPRTIRDYLKGLPQLCNVLCTVLVSVAFCKIKK